MTEGRDSHGVPFGLDRLVDLLELHAADELPAAETVRRLAHAVVDHQRGHLGDDATLMVVEWSSAAARRSVP